MVVGADLDGVVTMFPIRINFKLPWWLGFWLAFVPPNKKMLEILNKWKANNDKIILVSARPKQLDRITRWWLKRHKAPYHEVFFVGLEKGIEQRKLEIIKKEGVDIFLDDNEAIVNFLRQENINALSPTWVL